MIAALRTPVRRIAFAIALSAMVHAVVLWLPYLRLPREQLQLPPLTARLAELHSTEVHPAAKPEAPIQVNKPDNGVPAKQSSNSATVLKKLEKSAASPLFPKHLQISFAVYKGTRSTRIGVLRHQLDISGDQYTLQATRQTGGLTSLSHNDQLSQQSMGKIGEHGLQPGLFKEELISASGKQNLEATFNWPTQKLHFLHGRDMSLPEGAQDALSFMYQFSQLSIPAMRVEFFPLSISDGTQLNQCQVEIGAAEEIITPVGKLHALHLRKMHVQGEAYFEIWLGQEYRLLPVKIRWMDGSDRIIEEDVITDIRAADK